MIPLDEAFALSTEIGWNQTREDWARLMSLAPDGCFGEYADGKLVASGVALIHEPRLAWIGMVLTSVAHRGKGLAGLIMRRCIEHCDKQGVRCIKLDATELGRPVYAKLGFVEERPVSRWMRAGGSRPSPVAISGAVDFALDEEAFGASRRAMLEKLPELYAVHGEGFAFGRAGRQARHFGPCVSRSALAAKLMLNNFLSVHGDEPSILDLCDEHEDARRIASNAGYQPIRHLTRMYRGDGSYARIASGDMIYTLGAFEYG